MKGFFVFLLGALFLGTPALAAPSNSSNPWANSPGKKEFPEATAIILKDDISATVNADGTHDLVEYDAIKVLDKTGVERFSHTQRIYDSQAVSVEVKLARVCTADGRTVDVPASQITDTVPELFAKYP